MSNDSYPVRRDLDGVYYRVMRGGKPHNLCFSDLTGAERDAFMARLDESGLKLMCCILADCLRALGDQFDIAGTEEDDDGRI